MNHDTLVRPIERPARAHEKATRSYLIGRVSVTTKLMRARAPLGCPDEALDNAFSLLSAAIGVTRAKGRTKHSN